MQAEESKAIKKDSAPRPKKFREQTKPSKPSTKPEDDGKTKTQLRKERRQQKEQERMAKASEDRQATKTKKVASEVPVTENQKKEVKERESQNDANQCTLFVRNIGWDTTQEDFKTHMEQFGAVKYAVLCKP